MENVFQKILCKNKEVYYFLHHICFLYSYYVILFASLIDGKIKKFKKKEKFNQKKSNETLIDIVGFFFF